MAKNNGGTWLLVALLIGAVGLAGRTPSSSSSSSSSSSGEFSFASQDNNGSADGDGSGDACDTTTSFDSDQGRYIIPADHADSQVAARDCILTTETGEGAPVEALQIALKGCYFQGIETDGDFGTATRDALAHAQAVVGLDPDGNYGPQTAGAIAWPTTDDDGNLSCVAHPI
jgi:peptidoglycan hydrolase-like protein with peptidoglycan-binding domain